jgi:divalent metal cation (Fe/Co/Zn/Cd) transporter
MDAVEPELLAQVETAVNQHPAVTQVEQLRLRWLGHQLHGDVCLVLQETADPTSILAEIRHQLAHDLPKLTDLTIEVGK